MHFPKDILLIDFETTKQKLLSEPIQIGAVLLDKDTLAEKKSYVSLIRSEEALINPSTIPSNIPIENLREAPSVEMVARQFVDQFGFDVMLSSWVYNLDRLMLDKLMASIGQTRDSYDYHCLDLWPVAYIYLLKNGYTGSIRSEEIFQAFGQPARGDHDALEDCRFEAEILRKILLP